MKFVRIDPCRNENHAVQLKLLHRILSQEQVAVVDRIKTTAKKSNAHEELLNVWVEGCRNDLLP